LWIAFDPGAGTELRSQNSILIRRCHWLALRREDLFAPGLTA
jgi:hypothetical protein